MTALDIPCPTCGAHAGEKCSAPKLYAVVGRVSREVPHPARLEEAIRLNRRKHETPKT